MTAERIRALREQKKMTQAHLAGLTGVTRSCVNAWEMGISVPSTQAIVELAQIFSVSTDYLLCVDATATLDLTGLSEQDITMVAGVADYLRDRSKQD